MQNQKWEVEIRSGNKLKSSGTAEQRIVVHGIAIRHPTTHPHSHPVLYTFGTVLSGSN